jgi:hypothetical protein
MEKIKRKTKNGKQKTKKERKGKKGKKEKGQKNTYMSQAHTRAGVCGTYQAPVIGV